VRARVRVIVRVCEYLERGNVIEAGCGGAFGGQAQWHLFAVDQHEVHAKAAPRKPLRRGIGW
jgi:hypothetical protein